MLAVARRDGLPELAAPPARGRGPRTEAVRAGAPALDAAAEARFAALRAWRAEAAKAAGLPAYMILHDSTLREIAADPPPDLPGLARRRGMGPRKIEAWGQDLLTVLAANRP